ncbi:MAG: DUF1015 domain-containing protein [Sphingomonadales bacterium]|nr:DUF1015 domain-containing protein [Sphingomonadales bacterium]
MVTILPFRALRPTPSLAMQVASRPYDVLNSAEARDVARDNPYSFLHVTKSEIDLAETIDIHSQAVYQKANENLQQFIRQGTLIQEDKPCYYIYQLTMNGRSQTGLVAVSSVEDYHQDRIKKHEFTRPEKEKDRIDHMYTIKAQTGNVFLAMRDVPALNQLMLAAQQEIPLYDFVAEDGIRHCIWVVDQPQQIEAITRLFQEQVPCTYIADGHHRAASAAKVSDALPDSDAARYFLTTIFPASQLAILDYNRVIKDLYGQSATDFITKLETDFTIRPSDSAVRPSQLHEFGMYLEGKWHVLKAKEGTYDTDPIGVLDITILTKRILEKLLGITDQRTDTRIDFVGGIRGLTELEKRVDSGEMKVAFSLYPVSIEQLFAIADSGEVMPPKSTWFEPKLRDGLLTHLL